MIVIKNRQLQDVSDWEVIQAISSPFDSEEAFSEFYFRYKNFLLKVCRGCCKNFDDSNSLADDIFQNTFIKVLQKSHTFKPKESDLTTDISKDIKAWLARIARNELINFLRKNPDEKNLSNSFRPRAEDLEDSISFEIPESSNEVVNKHSTSIEKKLLETALNTLTEKERYILMVYMEFFNPGDPKKHLPEDILRATCNRYHITPDNLRQIKSRTLKKIKSILNKE